MASRDKLASALADPETLPGGCKVQNVLDNMKTETPTECRDEQIRILAYLKWEQATGGNPVDDEQAKQFWLEAEQEVGSDT